MIIRIAGKIMKWLGISIGALLVLIILASLIMNVIFSRELRQTMEKLKAEGRPLTVDEIRPAPIPDNQNAAPLLQKVAELMGYGNYTNTPPKAASAIKELSSLIETNSSNLDISTWSTAHREALPHLIQSPEMVRLFAILHEASQKPGYNNNLKYEYGPGAILPNLGAVRQSFRFLGIKAELAAQNGNIEEASATILETLRLGNLLQQEPTLITQLVRFACDRITIDCLERITNKTGISTDKAHDLIAELTQHTDPKPMIRSMDGERVCMGIWLYHLTGQKMEYKDFAEAMKIAYGYSPGLVNFSLRRYISGPLVNPLVKKDISVYVGMLSQMQDYYKTPYYQVADAIRNKLIESQTPKGYIIGSMMVSGLSTIVTRNAEHDAAVHVARVGLTLKLSKQKYGAYPDTLDKLAPEFLPTIPIDPFTGKALVYRKADAGFILYSLGPNQQDDNGTPEPVKRDDKVPYDIVWKCTR